MKTYVSSGSLTGILLFEMHSIDFYLASWLEYFISTIKYCRINSSIVKVIRKLTVILNDVTRQAQNIAGSQLYLDLCLTSWNSSQ